MKKSLFILLLQWPMFVFAQEFAIKSLELTPDQVVLYYDLIDTTRNRAYTIHLYSSRDNFIAPLTKVAGDNGLEVKPGMNKRIVWSSKEELGANFNGDVELEVRGRVYVPFIRFEGFDKVSSVKRKTPVYMKWTGGTRQNILNFQLFKKSDKGDKLVHVFPNVANASEYNLVVPSSVRPGSGYYFLVSDTKNKDLTVRTSDFKVKRKIPLALKALGVAAVGYGLYAFLGGSDEPDEPAVKEAPNLLPFDR